MRPADSSNAISRPLGTEPLGPHEVARPLRAPVDAPDVAADRVKAGSPLFRARVLRRYARGESVAEVLEVGGSSSWVLCICAAACFVVGAGVALFVRVEVISRARGVMRPSDEIVAITTQIEGVVSEVHAAVGQQVERGELLLSVDSASVQRQVQAPLAGTIESILVRPGVQVSAAAPIGRIVPRPLSERVVVFVPERDRAFIRPGAGVRLAVDQLPLAEFGWMTGRVARVAMAMATPDEIRAVLGSERGLDGAHYRVEVTLVDDARRRRLMPLLPASAILSAHITLRTQTVAAMMLRPLRDWAGP